VNEPSIAAAPKAGHPWHQAIALPPWPGAAEAFDGAIQALIDEFGAEEIWVFGSCAGGKPTRDSDLDLMVVRSARPDCPRPSWEALRVIRPHHKVFGIDLFVITPELWSQRRLRPNGVYLDVVRHGIRVYARRPQ
jgi:predicted nucleotidyltransferase